MALAIEEARQSLREGNSGFGAVIAKNGSVVARAHDTDTTSGDPTAHAEMSAIRMACAQIGKDLGKCVLVSTHEPCPMCSTAAIWAGLEEVAYGFSIKEAIEQGRRRIDFPMKRMYSEAGKNILVHGGVLQEECSMLYNKEVREQISLLRGANEEKLQQQASQLCRKRVSWFKQNYISQKRTTKSVLDEAYQLFLDKLAITAEEAPVKLREADKLVIHSRNFCPTLEACKILDMDTRFVCLHLTEGPTRELLRQIDPRLNFKRNYEKLRPYTDYCEEMILLE
ncbi:MAG: nucleoside deaminase [Desulfobulbaceae bacterium]|nr:nucleoside deaminase [Desulfobulbaceae bacterium]